MYCGDETGAFVGDCGHATSRFGYGGEDTPKVSEKRWMGIGSGIYRISYFVGLRLIGYWV